MFGIPQLHVSGVNLNIGRREKCNPLLGTDVIRHVKSWAL